MILESCICLLSCTLQTHVARSDQAHHFRQLSNSPHAPPSPPSCSAPERLAPPSSPRTPYLTPTCASTNIEEFMAPSHQVGRSPEIRPRGRLQMLKHPVTVASSAKTVKRHGASVTTFCPVHRQIPHLICSAIRPSPLSPSTLSPQRKAARVSFSIRASLIHVASEPLF